MQLCNQLNLMYETDNVDPRVQILTDNFLLAQDSCAPFEVKLIKRPPARWITETTKNQINNKYILSHHRKEFVGSSISRDLSIGIIIECFHGFGNTFVTIDVLIIILM